MTKQHLLNLSFEERVKELRQEILMAEFEIMVLNDVNIYLLEKEKKILDDVLNMRKTREDKYAA